MPIEKNDGYALQKSGLNYTTLPNQIADMLGNPDALAIWFYLYSKPADWICRPKDIMTRFSLGRDRYLKAMKELREVGVVWDYMDRDANGKIIAQRLVCSNLPLEVQQALDTVMPENPHNGKTRTTVKPALRENPHCGKPSTHNKELSSYKEQIVNKENTYVHFDQFWSIYPKKVGKKKVEGIWKRLRVNDILFNQIFNHLSVAYKDKDKQFIPNPETYLNQHRWEDEVIHEGQQRTNQSSNVKPKLSAGQRIRAAAAERDRRAVGVNGGDVRSQMDEQFRGGAGSVGNVGSIIDGDYTRTD